MINKLGLKDVSSYKRLRLLSLKTDPKSYLSTFDREKNLDESILSIKISFNQAHDLFGYWGYFIKKILIAYVEIASGYYFKKRHILFINELYVHPKFRRKKVATRLINYLIKKVRENKETEEIQLRVNSKNKKAIGFYEKLNFKKSAIHKKAVKEADGSYQDEYLYTLPLD